MLGIFGLLALAALVNMTDTLKKINEEKRNK